MDPKDESKDVAVDEGVGEHTGPTPATSAVETLPDEFGDLEGTEAG